MKKVGPGPHRQTKRRPTDKRDAAPPTNETPHHRQTEPNRTVNENESRSLDGKRERVKDRPFRRNVVGKLSTTLGVDPVTDDGL